MKVDEITNLVHAFQVATTEEHKITATKFADKFQSDLDNYVAAHKLEWTDNDEAVRDTLAAVIKELRER